MGLFRQPKPRRFHHPYIYVDERKERLERMREKAREDLGLSREKPVRPEDIRGQFVGQTTHLRRRKERGTRSWHPGVLLFLIALLAFLWYVLFNGKI